MSNSNPTESNCNFEPKFIDSNKSSPSAPSGNRNSSFLANTETLALETRAKTSTLIRRLSETKQLGGSRLNPLSISRIAYGEIRSHALTSNGTPPGNLAHAVASIGAACRRGNPCTAIDGSNASGLDKLAWRNIRQAVGGQDRTGGGNLMCVKHQNCKYVHSAYTWVNGKRTLVKRSQNLRPSGTVTIQGSRLGNLTLYFYKLPYKGWLHARDLQGPPRNP